MSTMMRILPPPGGTTIVRWRGGMNALPAIGAWPVIVIRYVPGLTSNANRPWLLARTVAPSAFPSTVNFAPAIGRGAPGGGPPIVTITPRVRTRLSVVAADPRLPHAETTSASNPTVSARYQFMPIGP